MHLTTIERDRAWSTRSWPLLYSLAFPRIILFTTLSLQWIKSKGVLRCIFISKGVQLLRWNGKREIRLSVQILGFFEYLNVIYWLYYNFYFTSILNLRLWITEIEREIRVTGHSIIRLLGDSPLSGHDRENNDVLPSPGRELFARSQRFKSSHYSYKSTNKSNLVSYPCAMSYLFVIYPQTPDSKYKQVIALPTQFVAENRVVVVV